MSVWLHFEGFFSYSAYFFKDSVIQNQYLVLLRAFKEFYHAVNIWLSYRIFRTIKRTPPFPKWIL